MINIVGRVLQFVIAFMLSEALSSRPRGVVSTVSAEDAFENVDPCVPAAPYV